jgi:predicted nucleic acid-binding protein
MADLSPVGTLRLILKTVKNYILDFDQFLSTLDDIIRSGFYLKEEVCLKAVRKARELGTTIKPTPLSSGATPRE